MIHASAGVATSAQAMAYAWEAHYLSACALTRWEYILILYRYVGILILGALLIVLDRVLMIAVWAYNLCA